MAIRVKGASDGLKRTTNLPTDSAFTYMAWVYPVGSTGGRTTFLFFAGSTTSLFLTTDNSVTNQLVLFFGGSNVGSLLTYGVWTHLTLWGNGSNYKVYKNGVEDISIAYGASNFTDMWVGNDDFNQYANSRLAHVRLWTTALTLKEIRREMLSPKPIRKGNLNTYAPCNPGSRNKDFSGNGYDFTEFGTPSDEANPMIPVRETLPFYFANTVGGGGGTTQKFRRTLSVLGTRTGSRQSHF